MDKLTLGRIKVLITWLLGHWYIPFAVLASAVGYTLLKRGPSPTQRAQVEIDALAAKREVAQIAIDQGAEAAHAHVAQNYAAQQASLDQERRRDADKLQDDPAELAAYLVRVAGNSPADVASHGPRSDPTKPPTKPAA